MEFKGTKGKWVCIGGTELQTSRIIIGNAHDIELEINGKDRLEEEVANALLISKAPELLKMLIKLCKLNPTNSLQIAELMDKAEVLIKEATEIH